MSFIFIVSILVLILDQATKSWIRTIFYPGSSHPVFPGIFHLSFVTNTGSAFGLFPGGGPIFIFFSILAIVILLVLAWQKRGKFSFLVKLSFGLLLGGVSGNLIDRIRFGAVLDFLDFRIWPVFNIADSGITLGVIFLSFHALKNLRAPNTF